MPLSISEPVGFEKSSATLGWRRASSAFFGYPTPVVRSIVGAPWE
jgi:hypothetical protein